MSDSISPLAGVQGERRGKDRRGQDRRAEAASGGKNLPVPIGPAERITFATRPAAEAGLAPFAAQLIGQDGQRRGLKGGQPVLDKARSAYLTAEWSGPNDRRVSAGKITRTKI
jgi:hypothetical protein